MAVRRIFCLFLTTYICFLDIIFDKFAVFDGVNEIKTDVPKHSLRLFKIECEGA